MVLLVALVVQDSWQELVALALSTAIPVNTCRPPRHFLAIKDWAEHYQDPEGNWRPRIWFLYTGSGVPLQCILGSPRYFGRCGESKRKRLACHERDMHEKKYVAQYQF